MIKHKYKKSKYRKGVAIELAIITILTITALSIMMFIVVKYISDLNLSFKSDRLKSIQLTEIGNSFVNSLDWYCKQEEAEKTDPLALLDSSPNTSFWYYVDRMQKDDETDSDVGKYKLTVKDLSSDKVVLSVIAEITKEKSGVKSSKILSWVENDKDFSEELGFTKKCIDYNGIYVANYKDVNSKSGEDLAAWAINAYNRNWNYVSGGYGLLLNDKSAYGNYYLNKFEKHLMDENYSLKDIDALWEKFYGTRIADCIGLIKGYAWYSASEKDIPNPYADGMDMKNLVIPDLNAPGLYDFTNYLAGNEDYNTEFYDEKIWESYKTKYSSYSSNDIGECKAASDLKYKGLIVFYNDRSGDSFHVGIYIGDGKIIHESSEDNGIMISPWSENWKYWAKLPGLSYSLDAN